MNKTLFKNHQIIPNSNQYFYEKKYFSFHSEDRDFIKYPNSSEFEIILPQDYLNVASARLVSWSFPSNYSVFSTLGAYNVSMSFRFTNLYNPGEYYISDPLLEGIFAALYNNLDKRYTITIEAGFYNPDQMAIELTNKFNEAVTNQIIEFFDNNSIQYAIAKSLFLAYDRFKIVYNAVSFKLWFGNTTDQFVLTNEESALLSAAVGQNICSKKNLLPEFDSWGLPAYLGFSRCNTTAFSVAEYLAQLPDNSAINNCKCLDFIMETQFLVVEIMVFGYCLERRVQPYILLKRLTKSVFLVRIIYIWKLTV